ncbi:MAG: LysR family transcriptional regulator [Pseudomonadota bacterium]
METRDLQLFVSVASLGSFAAVARKHDLDPSSISRVISGLETEIGIRLFQRTTRTLSLTEEGEAYRHRIEPILHDLLKAGDDAQEGVGIPQGVLRLTSSVAFAEKKLIPALPEFRQRFPDLLPELILSDENIDLVTDRIDLALRLGNTVGGDVIASRWLDTSYRVCVSPDYIRRAGSIEKPVDLAAHKCVVFTLPDFRSSWLFKGRDGAICEIGIDAGIAISNALALRRAALEGLGPTLLANWLIQDDLESGNLIDVFPDYKVTATTFDTGVWFVYPSRNYLPNKVRVMIDFLREYVN